MKLSQLLLVLLLGSLIITEAQTLTVQQQAKSPKATVHAIDPVRDLIPKQIYYPGLGYTDWVTDEIRPLAIEQLLYDLEHHLDPSEVPRIERRLVILGHGPTIEKYLAWARANPHPEPKAWDRRMPWAPAALPYMMDLVYNGSKVDGPWKRNGESDGFYANQRQGACLWVLQTIHGFVQQCGVPFPQNTQMWAKRMERSGGYLKENGPELIQQWYEQNRVAIMKGRYDQARWLPRRTDLPADVVQVPGDPPINYGCFDWSYTESDIDPSLDAISYNMVWNLKEREDITWVTDELRPIVIERLLSNSDSSYHEERSRITHHLIALGHVPTMRKYLAQCIEDRRWGQPPEEMDMPKAPAAIPIMMDFVYRGSTISGLWKYDSSSLGSYANLRQGACVWMLETMQCSIREYGATFPEETRQWAKRMWTDKTYLNEGSPELIQQWYEKNRNAILQGHYHEASWLPRYKGELFTNSMIQREARRVEKNRLLILLAAAAVLLAACLFYFRRRARGTQSSHH